MVRLSHDLSLPVDAVTQKQAFLGMSGSGKTYGAGVFVEGLLVMGAQEVSSELVKEKRELMTAFQSLLNVIDDSHDEDLPVEILEARDEAYRAIAIKRGASQHHSGDATNMVPSETIASVTTWANETFGPATIEVQIDRAWKEFRELLQLRGLDTDKIAEEAADVCICLFRVIGTLDPEAINKKMAKNRARKWQVDGQGCAQHVEE